MDEAFDCKVGNELITLTPDEYKRLTEFANRYNDHGKKRLERAKKRGRLVRLLEIVTFIRRAIDHQF